MTVVEYEVAGNTYHVVTVPVIAGVATLPDGRTIASEADLVAVPVLTAPFVIPIDLDDDREWWEED